LPQPAPHLSLVVPVFNEASRMPASLGQLRSFLAAQSFSTELILVDDCSDRETASVLEEFVADDGRVTLLRNEENRGKGFSVARGMRAAQGAYRVFTDADLAYPAAEVSKILRDLEAGADVAIACRVLPESRYMMSPSFFSYLYTRHVMSRVYNGLVRLVLVPGVLDTQAGLKGFTARAAELIFSRVSIPRFGFDVEALFIAQKHGLAIKQTAVQFRYDEEATTVKFAKDAARMARDLYRIRRNDARGLYA
jgi:dolichyl-phosphate beta-glucosyltransferase